MKVLPPATPNRPVADDAFAEKTLTAHAQRTANDLYAVLKLASDCDFDLVRKHARETRLELALLRERPLTVRQRERLERLVERAAHAALILQSPSRRGEYDACAH